MEEENRPVDYFESKDVLGQDLPKIKNDVNKAGAKSRDLYDGAKFPNLLTRVKALMIDVIVILIIFSISSIVIDKIGEIPDWIRGLILIFCLYLYEPLFISLFGGTIGHNVLKVNVRKIGSPDKKLNILQASLRFITKYLLGWLSFLTITGNKRKRAIHDMASGSIVLYK
jgi:uncharacterized RDD family membrane protein YckC